MVAERLETEGKRDKGGPLEMRLHEDQGFHAAGSLQPSLPLTPRGPQGEPHVAGDREQLREHPERSWPPTTPSHSPGETKFCQRPHASAWKGRLPHSGLQMRRKPLLEPRLQLVGAPQWTARGSCSLAPALRDPQAAGDDGLKLLGLGSLVTQRERTTM